jgi:hypothetical protein
MCNVVMKNLKHLLLNANFINENIRIISISMKIYAIYAYNRILR